MRKQKLNPILLPERLLNDIFPYNRKGGWDEKTSAVEEFKETIKKELRNNQNNRCAYCDLPLDSRNPEIDHIAPKGGSIRPKYVEWTFLPLNLVYACHNCNSSECKGQKDVVVENSSSNYEKCIFSIVHPYFDQPSEYFHMSDDGFIYPIPKIDADEYHKKKAKKTIDMFKLNEEGKLTEILKQIEFDKNPEGIQKKLKRLLHTNPSFRFPLMLSITKLRIQLQ